MEDVCTKFRQTKCCFEVLQPLNFLISWKNRSRTLNRAQHLSSSTAERGGSRLGKISSSFYHYYASTRLAWEDCYSRRLQEDNDMQAVPSGVTSLLLCSLCLKQSLLKFLPLISSNCHAPQFLVGAITEYTSTDLRPLVIACAVRVEHELLIQWDRYVLPYHTGFSFPVQP